MVVWGQPHGMFSLVVKPSWRDSCSPTLAVLHHPSNSADVIKWLKQLGLIKREEDFGEKKPGPCTWLGLQQFHKHLHQHTWWGGYQPSQTDLLPEQMCVAAVLQMRLLPAPRHLMFRIRSSGMHAIFDMTFSWSQYCLPVYLLPSPQKCKVV